MSMNHYGITDEQWEQLCAFFAGKCPRCGNAAKLTMDHIVPTSKGGKYYDLRNMQPLCGKCNSSKSTSEHDYRPPHVREWAKQESGKQGPIRDQEWLGDQRTSHTHNVSFTDEEERKLQELIAAQRPRSLSAYVGHLISDEHARSIGTLVDPFTYKAGAKTEETKMDRVAEVNRIRELAANIADNLGAGTAENLVEYALSAEGRDTWGIDIELDAYDRKLLVQFVGENL